MIAPTFKVRSKKAKLCSLAACFNNCHLNHHVCWLNIEQTLHAANTCHSSK